MAPLKMLNLSIQGILMFNLLQGAQYSKLDIEQKSRELDISESFYLELIVSCQIPVEN